MFIHLHVQFAAGRLNTKYPAQLSGSEILLIRSPLALPCQTDEMRCTGFVQTSSTEVI